MENHPCIIGLESGKEFAELIRAELNNILDQQEFPYRLNLTKINEVTFANGEIKVIVGESIRGKDVYIVQLLDDPTSPKSINDNLMSLATAINAVHYSDPYRITAVIPQYPYSRQDKRRGRESITAKLIGNLLEISGAHKVITLDVHSDAIIGFFDKLHVENLHFSNILIQYINQNLHRYKENMVVVAPDVGSAKRGLFFAKSLGVELAIIDKARDYSKTSTVNRMQLVGNVKGKNVLLPDDMLATGSTLLKACEVLKENGAQEIFISVSLPFFSTNSYLKFDEAHRQKKLFAKIIGTNAVFWGKKFLKKYTWYHELDVSKLFAQVIYNIHNKRSVSRLLQ